MLSNPDLKPCWSLFSHQGKAFDPNGALAIKNSPNTFRLFLLTWRQALTANLVILWLVLVQFGFWFFFVFLTLNCACQSCFIAGKRNLEVSLPAPREMHSFLQTHMCVCQSKSGDTFSAVRSGDDSMFDTRIVQLPPLALTPQQGRVPPKWKDILSVATLQSWRGPQNSSGPATSLCRWETKTF